MIIEKVIINEEQCQLTADIIGRLKLRDDFYQREFLNSGLDRETQYRMLFYAVAICHQTHILHHPGFNLWGWDYLEHAFLDLAKNKPELINPAYSSEVSVNKLVDELKPFFSFDGHPDNCTLDRLGERAELMIEASNLIDEKFGGQITGMINSTGQKLYNDGKGMYEVLAKMEAFSDPFQKKSTFLIKLLEEASLLKIEDSINFIPIMDYHMQRVLLRLGCVVIIDKNLHQQLIERTPMDSDEAVRSACIEAFKSIADHSGYPVTKMNDFFWSLGRSCCNETTLCQDGICDKSPCTLTQIVHIKSHKNCIFEKICKGYQDESYRNLWQPIVKTHFY